MSNWKVLVAGLVAAAVLFGVGFVLGHVTSTSGDPERIAWEARVDSLLGEQRDRHRVEVRAIRDSFAGDTATVARLRRAADRERAAGRAWQAVADTLQGQLAQATVAADSLDVYPALLVAKDSALSREIERGDSLELAVDVAVGRAVARLLEAAEKDSVRIAELERELEHRPKPSRWRIPLLGLDVRPCAFAGIGIDRRGTLGAGACLTP